MKVHDLAMIITIAMFGFFGCSEKPDSGTTENTEVSEQPAGTGGEREIMIDKVDESMSEAANTLSEAAKEAGDAAVQGVESVKEAASEAADVIESNTESIMENMEQSAVDSEPADMKPVEETVVEEKVEQVEEAEPMSQ